MPAVTAPQVIQTTAPISDTIPVEPMKGDTMFKPTLASGRVRRQLLAAVAGIVSTLALPSGLTAPASAADAPAASAPLKIGIIGTGRIGGALARHWAKAGHELMISSRHPEELQPLAKELGPNVKVGTPQQAAAFGDVILVSVPFSALPQIGKDYAKELAGKIILDTTNPSERRDGEMAANALRKGVGLATAEYLNSKRLVRAFNCINFNSVTDDAFRKQGARRGIPIGGDDAEALAVASRLVGDAGFDAAVIGSLASTSQFQLGEILANRDWSASEFKAFLAKK
jgi:8-hydroxy-5-deazaflavin:NADPH oxidoreductase